MPKMDDPISKAVTQVFILYDPDSPEWSFTL